MAKPKHYVAIKDSGKIGIHTGNRPANPLSKGYRTRQQAEDAKADIIKEGKAQVTTTTKKRGSGSKP